MTDPVATYPRIVAVVDTPTGGTVSIDGRTTPVEGVDEQAVRKEIHALVTATAIELHRPVRLTTRDSLGEQQFAVHPDGRMEALTPLDEASAVSAPASPVVDSPPAGAPAAPMTRAEAKRPTLDDFLQSRPPAPVGPATMGWQVVVRRLTAGLVSPRPSEFELAHRSAIERVQRPLRGPRTVVVINPKGGAHKTTATLLLAATFGTHRGGSTLAWDNNETRGTLGWRAQPARHQNTAVDLLRDLDRFNDVRNARVGDLDNYTRLQGSTQFDVLASDEDAAADQLVIVSTVREDTAASAAWLVDGLTEKGHEAKVRQAVTVLASPAKVADPQLHDRLHSHFNSLTRAVLDVPHDPALVDGGTLNFDALSAETREAWLQVTATVADGL